VSLGFKEGQEALTDIRPTLHRVTVMPPFLRELISSNLL
jgi:hypothetical protein